MEPHACNSCSFLQSAVATSEITCDLPTLEQCKSKDFLKSRFFRWPPPISKSVTFDKRLNCRSLKYLWYSKKPSTTFLNLQFVALSLIGRGFSIWPLCKCSQTCSLPAEPEVHNSMLNVKHCVAFFLELRLQSGKKIRSESNREKKMPGLRPQSECSSWDGHMVTYLSFGHLLSTNFHLG